MSLRGLHGLMGAHFEHRRAECETCAHRIPTTPATFPPGWREQCDAKGKILCCDRPRRKACAFYAAREETGATP
jgi:hypothetical protein